jgi:hypothetical protein
LLDDDADELALPPFSPLPPNGAGAAELSLPGLLLVTVIELPASARLGVDCCE